MNQLPIGVFDSGIGGLTVLAALSRALPSEDLLYLGDTARVPYGTRSPETVTRYSARVASHLYRRGVKALVIACNTATTHALPTLTAAGAAVGVPVIGVVKPGVDEADRLSRGRHVAILGTEGTVRAGRYQAALEARGLRAEGVACPLFVSLAEEGWIDGDVPRLVAERYLGGLRGGPDTVILGCTHFPLLRPIIQAVLPGVTLIDSAEATKRLLGNGYCTRPLELDCRYETICESCTMFFTTIEHRPTLQAQRDDADTKGQTGRRDAYEALLKRLDPTPT